MIWTGRVISALVSLFMLMDGVMKIVKPAQVVQATVKLGYPESSIAGIGIALLVCTILYMIPRTAIWGAQLLTGYLGGAVASQVRIGEGVFTVTFPAIFAGLVWLGLWLRDQRVRALLG